MSTLDTSAPQNPRTESKRGANGLSLGVHEVFDESERQDYLNERFASWHILAPRDYQPKLSDLPPVHPGSALHLGVHASISDKTVARFRACAADLLDHYFPPIRDESVTEDIVTFTKQPHGSYPAGTGVVIRKTSKAVQFCIDPSICVDADGTTVTDIRIAAPSRELLLVAAAPIDEAKIVTKILGAFASMLPGGGAIAKVGIDLVSTILGMAGSNGPSWSQITTMVRQVVREELLRADLEHIHADYQSIKTWSDFVYLPSRSGMSREQSLNMLAPQINMIATDLHRLLEHDHRIPGFALLLLGVDVYLGLLQEQIALGYEAKITEAGNQWAQWMQDVWKEVREDRKNQITVSLEEYGVCSGRDVVTCYYWMWHDRTTGESRGSRSGPWQAGGKDDHSERNCRADADAHFNNIVLPSMVTTFADPDATARAWQSVRVHAEGLYT